jgi:hypothetical protein
MMGRAAALECGGHAAAFVGVDGDVARCAAIS